MKKLIFTLIVFGSLAFSQITGLEGWDIYLDPGHSGKENMGIYGYSEAERNLRVGLRLREMLLNETDIDTVYICRTNDTQSVSLSQRTTDANTKGATWYHSIHSDAGASTYNSTLLLYGGWRQNGQTVEKTPKGGKKMADIMVDELTRGMRTNTRGNYADRTFYQGFPDNHENKYPYLHVNRESNMASELSEAGFHTNPRQNQLFMNDDWKRLEARTFFWSILKYHRIQRPKVRILTGIIKDKDTSVPLNGAEILVEEQTYTTDTYASLFHKYTTNPDLLHNGFYYFEDIQGDEVEIVVQADGYYTDTLNVSMMDSFFTFVDVSLISTALPTVVSTNPADGDTGVSVLSDIIFRFNRPMNPDSVEKYLVIEPSIECGLRWSDINRELKIIPNRLEFRTDYTVTIPGAVTDDYGHLFDGNNDGVGGDDFVLNFKTGFDDVPPQLVQFYPPTSALNIELQPIISFEYDEELDPESLTDSSVCLERFSDGTTVNGTLKHYVVNNRSVLNFFPAAKLDALTVHVSQVGSGLTDLLGNEITKGVSKSFKTGDFDYTVRNIDTFESGLTTNWWAPETSGSTTGHDPSTARSENTEYTNLLTGSTKSLQLYYDWDLSASVWLLRVVYKSGSSTQDIYFGSGTVLQVYLFGDGSGNQFRFAIDEVGGSSPTEVSKWYTVDWIGWKLVEWYFDDPEGVGSWIGDGVLDGSSYRFDSIQLTHVPGAAETGSVYFDDLRVVALEPVSIVHSDELLPEKFRLYQNYPNPFNPTTRISFTLPVESGVRLEIYNLRGEKVRSLVSGYLNRGHYTEIWNGRDDSGNPVSSGIYLYRLATDKHTLSKSMMLLK